MHICFLLSAFHSASSGGGAESYVSTLADALVEQGHRVTVIAFGDSDGHEGSPQVRHLRKPNLHWLIYRGLPFAKSLALPVREMEWSRRIWSALIELHRVDPVDVVETGETLVLQQLTAGKKPPLVVRGHGNAFAIKCASGQSPGLGDRLGRRLQLAGMRRAAALTAVSRFQASALARELSLPDEAITVIPNPISPALLLAANKPREAAASSPIVLYSGRIEQNKGTLELLKSVPAVARSFPQVEYVIAGGRHNSIDEQTLERALATGNTRAQVRLLGHVAWQNLAAWYRRAAVFVMPSRHETFGLSVVEAMAFGIPVVACNVGGLPEIVIDGVTGLLVAPQDPEALAAAIKRLLGNPELRQRLGNAGRERVLSEYQVEGVARQTLQVYERVKRKAAGELNTSFELLKPGEKVSPREIT
jgi:glycosyltransferase involved in cell wall biosynthesis